MKIFKKLLLAFSTVALICALVGAVGWYGIEHTEAGLHQVGGTHLPAIQGLGLVMESMNSIKSAERTMINPAITLKDRRHEYDNLDQRWAEFQRGWEIFSATQKNQAEAELTGQVQATLNKWRKEHEKLTGLVNSLKLGEIEAANLTLQSREIETIDWGQRLEKAMAAGQPVTGKFDPRLNDPSKWLIVNRADTPEFADLLAKFREPFEKLQESSVKINRFLADGAKTKAAVVWRQEALPTLDRIREHFSEAKTFARGQLDTLEEARDIAFGSERQAFGATMAVFDQLYVLASRLADEGRADAARAAARNKMLALLAVLLGVACALSFGFIITRQTSRPIRQVITALGKISLGDTEAAATVKMGRAVNCSSRKNCGNRDCPSFGREDHCWVTSGSMAAVKHCPRAKKGEDCRTCELFGAKTETEELGSIVNGMANSLSEREELALAIADGDLTRRIDISSDKDGLGQALRRMQQSLLSVIGQTKLASNEIASGSMQIADSSQIMAQGASEQASSLEEISSAMTEMASQTRMTAEHANQARDLSTVARKDAEKGDQQMEQMIEAMQEILIASQKVANVIKVIDEIAFQTNMLALNAAVEAAHAGQHGKGFAVVAEEVRNLAARSAKAAKETEELIAGSVAKTQNGAQIADRTATALGEIVTGVSRAAELVSSIADASLEQSQGIEQVTQALGQIDQVTQQNSASAEEGAAAAEELSGQAAQLRELLQKFKVEKEQNRQIPNTPNTPAASGSAPARPGLAPPTGPVPAGKAKSRSQPRPPTATTEETASDPSSIIPLDDTEFGKY